MQQSIQLIYKKISEPQGDVNELNWRRDTKY